MGGLKWPWPPIFFPPYQIFGLATSLEQPRSLFWCHAVMSLQFTLVRSLASNNAEAGCETCERIVLLWSLLCNNNMAKILQRITSLKAVVRKLLVREVLQVVTRDLSVLLHKTKTSCFLTNRVLLNKFLHYCVLSWVWKNGIIISHSHVVHAAFASSMFFQIFDRMILGRLSFPGRRCFQGGRRWKYRDHKWYAIRKSLETADL